MRITLLLLVCIWLAPSMLLSPSLGQSAGVRGGELSFKILIDGKPAGWERVEETAQADGTLYKSSGELTTGTTSQKLLTTTEIKNGKPVRYTVEVTTGDRAQKLTVSFERGSARAIIESSTNKTERATRVDGDVILLDKNVWHQYRLLLSRYDLAARGKQRFNVFIPQAGLRQFSAEVELKDQTSINVRGEKRRANRFIVSLADGYDITVAADEAGTPLSIEVPSQDTKVVIE
jgi:hypothetical protein